jgi:hypothetical protein
MIAAVAALMAQAATTRKEAGLAITQHLKRRRRKFTQANFVSYQAARPEKLPEEARGKGFHYLDLKLFGLQFMSASGDKNKARVSKISKKK